MDRTETPIHYPLKPSKTQEEDFMIYLKDLYQNPHSGVAFSNPVTILGKIREDGKYENVGVRRLRKYLGTFDGYSLNRTRYISKKTRRYVNDLPGKGMESDLLSVERVAGANRNIKYLLVCVDIGSRLLFVEPLLSKEIHHVVRALDKVLSESVNSNIQNFHSDLGREYVGSVMVSYLRGKGITQTFAKQSTHANIVERVNRSLRRLLRAYMTTNKTDTYIDKLQKLVELYNNRPHSSLQGFTPNEIDDVAMGYVNVMNKAKWKERSRPRSYKFSLGDDVRIATARTVFDKHASPFTQEIFTVGARFIFDMLNIYQVKDCGGDAITGFFYEHELVKAKPAADKVYDIDRFIAEEKRADGVYVLVSFKGYPNKPGCNSWILKKDLIGK